jgi:prepilin-type N-terminal cleavage/methylation domain-containing protein
MKTNQKLPIADCRLQPESALPRRRVAALPRRRAAHDSTVQLFNALTLCRAFTLIELLTVIAVIGIIAALIFPVASTVKRQTMIHSAQAQMAQLETALERYKSAYGFYPPASAWALTNQLFYELEGTTNNGIAYMTLDHLATIPAASVGTVFGAGVGGFMNCNKPGADESARQAQSFLPDQNTRQFATVTVAGTSVSLVVTPVGGPDSAYNPLGTAPAAPADHSGVNPWRYLYPGTNNPGSYDLWIQLVIAGNTNLICNWTKSVEINTALP